MSNLVLQDYSPTQSRQLRYFHFQGAGLGPDPRPISTYFSVVVPVSPGTCFHLEKN